MTQVAVVPTGEPRRLDRLRKLHILDSSSEPVFASITRMACESIGTDIAMIAFIDKERVWILDTYGSQPIHELPRKPDYFDRIIAQTEVLVFSEIHFPELALATLNQKVSIPFFCGIPICMPDGEQVGALCLLHAQQHELSAAQLGILKNLAAITRDALLARQAAYDKTLTRTSQLAAVLESSEDAIILTNSQLEIEYLNPNAEKLTEWDMPAAVGKQLEQVFQIIRESTRLPAPLPARDCIARKKTIALENHTLLISRSGKEYGIEHLAAPFYDNRGEPLGAAVVFHDVTAQRQMANEINYRATHDPLTGLYNRAEFERRLENTLLASKENAESQHALLYLDLDQFKVINDTCGHSVGDRLLNELVDVIEKCIRTSDTLARLGGDEFGVILESCSAEPASRIAQQICQRLDKFRFQHENKRYRIGASIGVVIIDDHWHSITNILQAADSACYAAKEAGRNRVHLYLDADHAIEIRRGEMQWANRIEQAIEDNQFVLFCQRIMALDQNSGCRGEILIRMKDGKGGLIPPSAFLPAAERFHMASRIDRWVLQEVFNWMHTHAQDLDHIESLAVNLSGQSIGDSTFHQFVHELIADTSFDCSKLCFEITETAAITNLHEATRFIESMRQHMIRFSLDDFGSGVSSFGYLKTLPVDYLKIDGQFIRDLASDPIDQATVRCISEVARVTGKKTIAEWVENAPVEDMLKDIHIDFSQGYFRHKPAPLQHMLDIQCSYQGVAVH